MALPLDYDIERQQLARRKAIAEALLQQSAAPMGGTETVSGIAVRQSPLAGLAKLGQAYFAKKNIGKVEGDEKALGQRMREDVASAMSDYQKAVTPRASTSEQIIDEEANGGEGAPATITAPAYNPTTQDKQAAAFGLLSRLGGDPRDTAKLVVAEALKGPKLAAIDPKDYTPESFAAYTRTGDTTALRRAEPQAKPEGTPAAVREYEYAKTQGYKGSFTDWQLAQKRAGATTVSVSTGKKYGEAFAGKIADQDSAMLDAARKAPELADRANRILQTVASGKVITGAGADYRLALGKALNLVGASDAETIANTEAMSVDMARNTLDAIKSSGLGSGSGFSNADRDFLEKVSGGKITLEAATIKRIAELSHRAASLSVERWNDRVKNIPDDALAGTGIKRDPFKVNPLFAPAGGGKPRVSPDVQRLLDKYAPEGQ